MNPYESNMDALKKRLGDMKSPTPLAKEMGGYKAKSFSGPLEEFDLARKKANEQITTQASQNQDALTRRFARIGGGLQSGAFVKQAQQADEQATQQKAQAMESIAAQEAQARRVLEREEAQKEFQSQEAIAARNAQREQFNVDIDFRDRVFRFDANSKLAALDMQRDEQEFNKRVAMSQMDEDQLLGMGAEGDAYREETARKKGEIENAKNRAKDARREEMLRAQMRSDPAYAAFRGRL